jgi:hypothetical protein
MGHHVQSPLALPTHLLPVMVTSVGAVELHTLGFTPRMMGACNSKLASYGASANPAAVVTSTVPMANCVTHRAWECAYSPRGHKGTRHMATFQTIQ